MTNEKRVQLIEKYLNGSLNAKDSIQVEFLLITDEAFQRLFTSMKKALEFIRHSGRASLILKMKTWDTKLSKLSMKNHNNQERIEQYLTGRISVDEILEFEADLEKDPNFKQQFEDMKLLVDGIQYAGRRKLYKRMQQIDVDLDSEEPHQAIVKPFNFKRLMSVAAGIALLVCISFLIKLNAPTLTSDHGLATIENTYPSDIIQRSPVIDEEALARIKDLFPGHSPEKVYEAFLAYEGSNYEGAVAAFETLLSQNASPALSFYKGQALFANKSFEQSIKDFDNYLGSGEQRYFGPSVYYKGLALIELGKTSEVKQLWESFSKDDCHFCEKAKDRLEMIK